MSKFRRDDGMKEILDVQQEKNAGDRATEENGKNVTVYIDMDHLRPNKRNEYKMTDIENLSAMIKLSGGILQNLIIRPDDEKGYYIITTGERRWRAARLLRDRGEYPEVFDNKVPCTISDPEEIDLPLDREAKEDFSILVTNQYRDKTDGEMYMEIRKWKEIIGKLRKAGVEYLPARYNDEEGAELQIKGTKTRELIAAQMGVSDRQITRYESIDKHGSDKLMNMLMADELNLSAAEAVAKLPVEEQDDVLEQIREERPDDVIKAVKEKAKKKEKRMSLQKEEVAQDMGAIIELVTGTEISLPVTAYKKYKKAVGQISQLLGGDTNVH